MNSKTMTRAAAAVSLGIACLHASVSAQTQPAAKTRPSRECLPQERTATPSADQIRDRAARIKEMRALLEGKDHNLALATFVEMVRSCDVEMQDLAFDAGFNSADAVMRAIALRQRLVSQQALTIDVTYAAQKEGDTRPPPMNGRMTLPLILPDEASATAVISGKQVNVPDPKEPKDAQATVKAQGLELVIDASRWGGAFGFCHGRMRLGTGGALAGTMSCHGLPNLAITARML